MRQELKDSSGKVLGYVQRSGSKLVLYRSGGTNLGYYDEKSDSTRKSGGVLVGKGNLLPLLLK